MTNTNQYSLKFLLDMAKKTQDIDEGGDASFSLFLKEACDPKGEPSFKTVLLEYLVWANGEGWEEFLETAKPGDYPKKD